MIENQSGQRSLQQSLLMILISKKAKTFDIKNSAWIYIAIFSQGLGAALSFTISSFNIVRSWAVRTSLDLGWTGMPGNSLQRHTFDSFAYDSSKVGCSTNFGTAGLAAFNLLEGPIILRPNFFEHYHLFDEMFGQTSHYDRKYTSLPIYIITLLLRTTTLHITYPLQQKLYI